MFTLPIELVFDIREANYAVPRGDNGFDFVRIARIRPYRNGRRRSNEGSVVLSTQHSETWVKRFMFTPDMRALQLSSYGGEWASAVLARILVNPTRTASSYGHELGRCCRCGKKLTDDRSRWYGIGPECEKVWPEILYELDDEKGPFPG